MKPGSAKPIDQPYYPGQQNIQSLLSNSESETPTPTSPTLNFQSAAREVKNSTWTFSSAIAPFFCGWPNFAGFITAMAVTLSGAPGAAAGHD